MTFAQRRNPPTTHFSERIPVVERRISVMCKWQYTTVTDWRCDRVAS